MGLYDEEALIDDGSGAPFVQKGAGGPAAPPIFNFEDELTQGPAARPQDPKNSLIAQDVFALVQQYLRLNSGRVDDIIQRIKIANDLVGAVAMLQTEALESREEILALLGGAPAPKKPVKRGPTGSKPSTKG